MTEQLSSDRRTTTWHLLGLSIVVLLFFGPAFRVWFFQDDFALLRWGVGFEQDWRTAFTTITGGGTYRPLTQQVYFGFMRQLFDLNAAAFHVLGIALHGINTLLAYFILRRLVRNPIAALGGALFYAVHFAHIGAVYWLSAITETALVFCQFLGLWAWMRYLGNKGRLYYVLTVLALLAGILSQETIVTMPFLLALYALFAGHFRKLRYLVPHFVLSLGYVALRLVVGVFPAGPYKPEWGLPMVVTFAKYFQHSFGIYDFFPAVPHISEPMVRAAMVVLALATSLIAARRFRATPWPVFGLLYFLAAIGPLLVYSHHFTDYYLGVPLLGLAIVVADVFDVWCDRPRAKWLRWVLAAVVVFYLVGTALEFRRTGRWFLQRGHYAHSLFQGMQQLTRRLPPGCAVEIRGVGEEAYGVFFYGWGSHVAGFQEPLFLRPWRTGIPAFEWFELIPERRAGLDCLAEVELSGSQFQVRDILVGPGKIAVGARDLAVWPNFRLAPVPGSIESSLENREHPLVVRFAPEKVRSGRDQYTIEIPGIADTTVDLLISFRGRFPEAALKFCRLDAQGRARIFVPPGIRPGIVRVMGVRPSGSQRWRAAAGSIEVIP